MSFGDYVDATGENVWAGMFDLDATYAQFATGEALTQMVFITLGYLAIRVYVPEEDRRGVKEEYHQMLGRIFVGLVIMTFIKASWEAYTE